MADVRVRIIPTINDDGAIEGLKNNIRDLARETWSDAMKSKMANKEAIALLEKRVNLRNREVDAVIRGTRAQAQRDFDKGSISESQFQDTLKRIDKAKIMESSARAGLAKDVEESRQGKFQHQYAQLLNDREKELLKLKDIAEKTSINRQGTFRDRLREIELVRKNIKDHADNILKSRDLTKEEEKVVKSVNANLDKEEKLVNQEKKVGKGQLGRVIKGWGIQQVIQSIHEPEPVSAGVNAGSAAGQMMMMSGKVLSGAIVSTVAAVSKEMWQLNTKLHETARTSTALLGKEPHSYMRELRASGIGKDLNRDNLVKLGVSDMGYIERHMQTSRSLGRSASSDEAYGALMLERTGFSDPESINQALRFQRIGERDFTSRYASAAGAASALGAKEGDMTYVPEVFQEMLRIDKEQLKTIGRIDSFNNEKLLKGIMSMGGVWRDVEMASSMFGSIHKGLSTAQTPQVEAMQYQILSQMNPETSLWGLEKLKESPFKNGMDYFKKQMQWLKNMAGGSNDTYERLVGQVFDLGPNKAAELAQGWDKMDFSRFMGTDTDIKKIMEDMSGRSLDSVAISEKLKARFENFKTDILTRNTDNTREKRSFEKGYGDYGVTEVAGDLFRIFLGKSRLDERFNQARRAGRGFFNSLGHSIGANQLSKDEWEKAEDKRMQGPLNDFSEDITRIATILLRIAENTESLNPYK